MYTEFFPKRENIEPKIYAFKNTNPNHKNYIKIGYTTLSAEQRINQIFGVLQPETTPFEILLEENAVKNDGNFFSDHDVHKVLKKRGIKNPNGEWFECKIEDVKSAILSIKNNDYDLIDRIYDFNMRPEQEAAVNSTYEYFKSIKKNDSTNTPHFLWNAKMRFGKTFATYQLALKMKWTKLLILTFKPAVQNAWEEDLKSHIDFKNWQFITSSPSDYKNLDKKKPFICFASFQDFLGKNKFGGIKLKNEWAHSINWDCVVLDEYHYGAWRDKAKELFDSEEENEINSAAKSGLSYYDESTVPLTTNHYLYLSGTPFRAISSGEFIEEEIFNWTYSDEQKAKLSWKGEKNPYLSLPRMVMLAYELPSNIKEISAKGEFDEFDLNEFFNAVGNGEKAIFKHKTEVQKWLDLIRGSFNETLYENLRLGSSKPPMPFSDVRLKNILTHTLWFLPNVASCYAMSNLLNEKQNIFYNDYKIIVVAGKKTGIGLKALPPVLDAMGDGLKSKTITLTCGKLVTGVTVKPWTGIFMLRNTSSPETYFQAAFRVQNPWTIRADNPKEAPKIIKKECYIFDFAPNRALRLVAEYSCRLNINEKNPEQKVSEFIKFLPILCYDGSGMKEINASMVLDIASSGTSSTLLAKKWEHALLVNVDNHTLKRLLENPKAMEILMKIEGFRNLNKEIENIINRTEEIKNLKSKSVEKELKEKERSILSEAEKEQKSKRKMIQDKLLQFATRIPIFMYLTDYRERSLEDIITKLEPGLFKKVTALEISDFDLLLSLGVFNKPLMNEAIYKFKRYEDSSLSYLGFSTHKHEKIGLFDTVIDASEIKNTFVNMEV
jgi:hypothetical protein